MNRDGHNDSTIDIIVVVIIFTLGSIWSRGTTKIAPITKYYKLAGMTSHLVNKTVMKQNCIEALNQHAQPLKKKAAVSNFTWNFGNPSTKTTEKRDSWTVNRAEWFHRSWLKHVTTFQRGVLGCLASCCKLSYRACALTHQGQHRSGGLLGCLASCCRLSYGACALTH